jgi:hypothetical protein
MSQSQTSSVIRPLESVRERVKQRLMQVPEYRAFLGMEKPIAEVAHISDLVAHLQTAQDKILERLAATKEYQALLTVEKAIQDLSQVLEVVDEGGNFDVEPAPSEEVLTNEEPSDIASLPVPETQQAVDQIAGVASIGETPMVTADETAAVTVTTPVTQSLDVTEPASSVEATGEPAGKSIWNPTARFSTLGLVEEWRLTAMVRESFSANGGNDDALFTGEGSAEAEKAKVA